MTGSSTNTGTSTGRADLQGAADRHVDSTSRNVPTNACSSRNRPVARRRRQIQRYALAEKINGLYKTEGIRRLGTWRNREALELATLKCGNFFNHRRLPASTGDIPSRTPKQNTTRKCVRHHRFESQQHANRAIADWIQFYNTRRPHQALGMKTPAEVYRLAG